MTVPSVSGATGASLPASGSSARTGLDLGYEAFVKLLLAQLKNQDPTKPMDATEYVSQLATLSQLEQTMKQSDKMDELLTRTSYSQAASIIGMRLSDRAQEISGVVTSVEILSDGVWATLDSGSSVRVGEGVVLTRQ
jgi:flagellar basal-body rod modification protein FlgD